MGTNFTYTVIFLFIRKIDSDEFFFLLKDMIHCLCFIISGTSLSSLLISFLVSY